MNEMSPARPYFLSVVLFVAGALSAAAGDHFSMAVGSHDLLAIFDAQGQRKAELPLPSISQAVVVDGATFQVSYGRDANGLLTAIISPNPTQPQDLHFTVLGKSIDTDKDAVVTLTFSKNLSHVAVDPGYIGEVQVNSHRLGRDSESYSPPSDSQVTSSQDTSTSSPAPETAVDHATTVHHVLRHESSLTTGPVYGALPPANPGAANQASTAVNPTEASEDHVSNHAPLPMQVNSASEMPFTASSTPGPTTVSVAGTPEAPKQHSLYWAEPITTPDGQAPSIGSDQMKLVALTGSVSITPPGGSSSVAQEGTIIPSGSTISTAGGSSVALFMGGVNSIRLMPDTEVAVTQQLDGSVRKTVVALHEGSIFNRVGHRDGERQSYQVQTPQGVAVAKGTEFADSLAGGHHYVFVVKGIVGMIINGIETGTLSAVAHTVATGAMPPSPDGNKVLFALLTSLEPFQTQLQKVIADIHHGTATPAELGYYNSLMNTFMVTLDQVYDPTHPNSFLGPFTSITGNGDEVYGALGRPQDTAPNPLNEFNGLTPPSHGAARNPFVVESVTPTGPST